MKRILLVAVAATFTLAGCHSFRKENIQPPTPLKDITPSVNVSRVWEHSVGDGAGETGVRMRPAYADGIVYAASNDGTLVAFNAASGDKVWSHSTSMHSWFGWGHKKYPDAHYAGGPAVSAGLLVIGTLDGHVYGYDAKTGKQRWMIALPSEVIGKPAVVAKRVVVRTEDGRVYGLDPADGSRQWVYDQSTVPALSLRGNGPLLVANGVVFLGTDDGNMVALRADNGEKLWSLPLSRGGGSTQIEQLDDADGGVLLDGTTLYAAAYHGELTAVDGPTGRPLWHHPFSSYGSLDISGKTLVGADDTSTVWAFDKQSGASLWKQDGLKWRWVSAPAIQGDYVVVGDVKGYVHWLKIGDGAFAARERLSHDAIRAQPLVVGKLVFVEDIDGDLAAYRIGAGAR